MSKKPNFILTFSSGSIFTKGERYKKWDLGMSHKSQITVSLEIGRLMENDIYYIYNIYIIYIVINFCKTISQEIVLCCSENCDL